MDQSDSSEITSRGINIYIPKVKHTKYSLLWLHYSSYRIVLEKNGALRLSSSDNVHDVTNPAKQLLPETNLPCSTPGPAPQKPHLLDLRATTAQGVWDL